MFKSFKINNTITKIALFRWKPLNFFNFWPFSNQKKPKTLPDFKGWRPGLVIFFMGPIRSSLIIYRTYRAASDCQINFFARNMRRIRKFFFNLLPSHVVQIEAKIFNFSRIGAVQTKNRRKDSESTSADGFSSKFNFNKTKVFINSFLKNVFILPELEALPKVYNKRSILLAKRRKDSSK